MNSLLNKLHHLFTQKRTISGIKKIGTTKRKTIFVLSGILLAGTSFAIYNEGTRRSLIFWGGVLPIWVHYKWVEWLTKGMDEKTISQSFEPLHELYAPIIEHLTLKLRGFYLKQAQIMSTLDDFVPPAYMKWCKKMQDEVPTEFAPGQGRQIVEKSLGKPIEEIFSYWDDNPRGAASIGQVHYAILKNGKEVAVKIQFPNIERRFRSDLKTVKTFCKLAMPQHVQPLEEMEKQFLTEFDYIKEAENLNIVARNLTPTWGDKIAVPTPIMELCRKDILVMDYLHGEKLVDGIRKSFAKYAEENGTTLEKLEEQQIERIKRGELNTVEYEKFRLKAAAFYIRTKDYFQNLLRLLFNITIGNFTTKRPYYWSETPINLASIIELLYNVHGHEIFIDGEFNGDPHPGNILLLKDGRIGLIDYGQVKRLDLETRINYARLIISIANDDREKMWDILVNDIGIEGKYMNKDIGYRLTCFWNDRNTPDIMMGMNIPTFLDYCQAEDPLKKMHSEYVVVARVSVLLRGMGNAFGMQLRTTSYWRSYAEKLLLLEGVDY